MKLKSYFSGTVEEAMDAARNELGEDALLVNARPATPETRHLGAYEVVFGSAPLAAARHVDSNVDSNQRMAQDVAEMRREIERLSRCFRGVAPVGQANQPEFYARLTANELDLDLAQAVVDGTPIEDLFEADATLGRIVALAGPPGAGKTTTLVKLAARYGLTSRRPAQILSADVYRIAAADQLRSLAAILGIGCEIVETPAALAQSLEGHANKDFVFIDTPGLARGEMEEGAALARLIAAHPEIDTHLVLPASMKAADMEQAIERYRIFRPGKLLFTRMDETGRYGSIVNQSARLSLPVSFLAGGQQIPDDLEPASRERIAALVLGASHFDHRLTAAAAAAAGARA